MLWWIISASRLIFILLSSVTNQFLNSNISCQKVKKELTASSEINEELRSRLDKLSSDVLVSVEVQSRYLSLYKVFCRSQLKLMIVQYWN